jgi:hypothetical protein
VLEWSYVLTRCCTSCAAGANRRKLSDMRSSLSRELVRTPGLERYSTVSTQSIETEGPVKISSRGHLRAHQGTPSGPAPVHAGSNGQESLCREVVFMQIAASATMPSLGKACTPRLCPQHSSACSGQHAPAFCAGGCILNFRAVRLAGAAIKSTGYPEYLAAVVRRWAALRIAQIHSLFGLLLKTCS